MSWSVGVIDGEESRESTDEDVLGQLADGLGFSELEGSEVEGASYFNATYRAYSIGIGIVWTFAWITPFILQSVVRPGRTCVLGVCTTYITGGTRHAWNVMRWTSFCEYGLLSIVWGGSYLHLKAFQKIYYRTIAWVVPISWGFALWIMLAFLIGGSQEGASLGQNFVHGLVWWLMLGGFQMIAWFIAPYVVKYYRWDEQPWWNYSREESP